MRLWSVLLVLTGCLSYEGFLRKQNEKYCEVQAQCNPNILCEVYDTGEPNCIFDAGAARDCLSGPWECDNQFPGFEEPIPPQICASVCGGIE